MYFREQLYNSISGSLKTINVSGSYATDIGNYVYEYQSDVANENEIQVYLIAVSSFQFELIDSQINNYLKISQIY